MKALPTPKNIDSNGPSRDQNIAGQWRLNLFSTPRVRRPETKN